MRLKRKAAVVAATTSIDLLQPLSQHTYESQSLGDLCLVDLDIDALIDLVCVGRTHQQEVRTVFQTPVHDAEVITFRQTVWADVAVPDIEQAIRRYVAMLGRIHQATPAAVSALVTQTHRDMTTLDSIVLSFAGATRFVEELRTAGACSAGLTGYVDALDGYLHTEKCLTMVSHAQHLRSRIDSLSYVVHVDHDCLRVLDPLDQTVTASAENVQQNVNVVIRGLLASLSQPAKTDADETVVNTGALNNIIDADSPHDVTSNPDHHDIDQIDVAILEHIERRNPDLFEDLHEFAAKHQRLLPESLTGFDTQIDFYLAWLDFIRPMNKYGYAFTLPQISTRDRGEDVQGCFDPYLARALAREGAKVTLNSYHLEGTERIVVVTGANQGGKTTFSRTVGILHYLASLGLPVPATSARLCIPDAILTHFPRQENPSNFTGRLQDDLLRFKAILDSATSMSLIIANESFASTTTIDALDISRMILSAISRLGCLCVYVTFLDELASLGPEVISMVATTSDGENHQRTHIVERRAADGHAYAIDLVHAHHLTTDEIIETVRK